MNKKDTGLILAIIFASVVVSGSLVFFLTNASGGASITDAELDKRIDSGIERYVKNKQAEMEESQAQAAAADAEKTKELAKNLPPVSKTADHIYGNVDAQISLVEYSDFQCPFCLKFDAIAKQMIDKYAGKVNWVYRHYPLPGHDPEATLQAMASECVTEQAGNSGFWKFSDILFDTRPADKASLVAAAKGMGLNEAQFTKCLDDQKYLSKIQQQEGEGSNAGVDGTPGNFVVDNRTGEAVLIPGAQALTVFQKVIDPLLAK